jgi:hypothetical protein
MKKTGKMIRIEYVVVRIAFPHDALLTTHNKFIRGIREISG